ncbi:MAG: hypothetical protein JKY52_11510 [Flavobacteriales bacterium]|nr:hypothetical protein [Flavobacteriales bacterium]
MQFGYNYIDGHRIYNNKGPVVQLPYRVQDYTFAAYAEYGLTNELTFIANIPFRALQTHGALRLDTPLNVAIRKGSLSAFGNIGISVSYGLRQNKPLVLSIQLHYDLPSATFLSSTGLRTGYDTFGVAPYVNVGYTRKNLFYSFKLGYNFRGDTYSDQFINRFEIGILLKEQLFLIIGHEALLSMHNGDHNDGSSLQTGLYANNTEYLTYNLKLGYKIKPQLILWLYVSGGYWGNAVLRSPAIGIALSNEWKKKR